MKREVAAERQVIFAEYVRFNRAKAVLVTEPCDKYAFLRSRRSFSQMLMCGDFRIFQWVAKERTAQC